MKYIISVLVLIFLCGCNFSDKQNSKKDKKIYERKGEDDIISTNEFFASENANKLSREGVSLGLEGKYEEAEKIFEKALKAEPNNPVILNNIGLTYYNRGIYNEAIKYYNHSLEVSDSTSLMAAVNLGLTYYQQMDYTRALKIMNFTLQKSENDNTINLTTRLHRLMVNIELENCDEIEKDRKAIEYLRYNNQVGDFKEKIAQIDKEVNKLCAVMHRSPTKTSLE